MAILTNNFQKENEKNKTKNNKKKIIIKKKIINKIEKNKNPIIYFLQFY